MKAVELDRIDTWPTTVVKRLERARNAFDKFEAGRITFEERCEHEPMLKYTPWNNPHQDERDETVRDLDADLAGGHLLGYHCTRLHRDEVAAIQKGGLSILTPELVTARVQARLSAGDISPQEAAALLGRNRTNEEYRIGRVWFAFTTSLLRQESGIHRLFRSWGGEAIYADHEEGGQAGPVLRTIGSPCIIEAKVPIGDLEVFPSIGEIVVRRFFSKVDVPSEHSVECEGHVRTDVKGIHRVVLRNDPSFEALTGCSAWAEIPR